MNLQDVLKSLFMFMSLCLFVWTFAVCVCVCGSLFDYTAQQQKKLGIFFFCTIEDLN